MRNLKLVVCAFALMALFAGLMPAASITLPPSVVTGVYTLDHRTNWPSSTFPATVSLDQWDNVKAAFLPSWASLVGIKIDWTGGVYGGAGGTAPILTITSREDDPVTVTGLHFGADVSFAAVDPVLLANGLFIPVQSLTESIPNQTVPGGGSGSITYPAQSLPMTAGSWSYDNTMGNWAAVAAAFSGPGAHVDVLWKALATSGYTAPSGNVTVGFDTFAKAGMTVTYYYTPEPSTFILLGSALCGLAFWGRKRATR